MNVATDATPETVCTLYVPAARLSWRGCVVSRTEPLRTPGIDTPLLLSAVASSVIGKPGGWHSEPRQTPVAHSGPTVQAPPAAASVNVSVVSVLVQPLVASYAVDPPKTTASCSPVVFTTDSSPPKK